jgi:peptidoglycan hydrolase CwlO-like protein
VCLTIEVALLISGVSVAFGIFAGISNLRRNQKLDDKRDATEMTTVIVKLENISNGITEIKSEINNVKNDIKEDRERIIRVEESAKQAHKRIDTLEKYKRGGDLSE